MHNCFKETAETFISCTGMKQPADYPIDIDKRKLKAIELTNQLAPELLQENKDLHFDLLSLHFVELVQDDDEVHNREALVFAQNELTAFGKQDRYVDKLEVSICFI
jgi:hypothetical protein